MFMLMHGTFKQSHLTVKPPAPDTYAQVHPDEEPFPPGETGLAAVGEPVHGQIARWQTPRSPHDKLPFQVLDRPGWQERDSINFLLPRNPAGFRLIL